MLKSSGGWFFLHSLCLKSPTLNTMFILFSFLQDVLTSEDCDKSTIIFLRDVSFSELQSLISFIYSGQAVVPGNTFDEKTLKIKNIIKSWNLKKWKRWKTPLKLKLYKTNFLGCLKWVLMTCLNFRYFYLNFGLKTPLSEKTLKNVKTI